MDPVIIASARKHGVHDDDIGVSGADGIDFILHAMPAGAKFIR